MKTKMTIHRALAELKLIDSRIEKKINEINPAGLMQKDKLVNGVYQKESFEKEANSKLCSIEDLIERKVKIKVAIVKANSLTIVKIAGKKMTIADAISFKTIIVFKKLLLETLKTKYNKVKSKFVLENEKVNNIALNNAKIMLGRQAENETKPTDKDVAAIMNPFVERSEYKLIDPLKIEEYIAELQKEIEEFETEVDAVLSEINAITEISI